MELEHQAAEGASPAASDRERQGKGAGGRGLTVDPALAAFVSKRLLDVFIRVGLIVFLVLYCYQIFRPFIDLTLWSIILAVAFYPLQRAVSRRLGGCEGLAASLLVSLILVGFLVPTSLLAVSFGDSISQFVERVRDGTLEVPEPPAAVSGWPLLGGRLHTLWAAAHTDLGGTIAAQAPKLLNVTKALLGYVRSVGTGLLRFLAAAILAGFWLAYASEGQAVARAIARRMTGPVRGEAMVELATTTIRAVAQGVIGIAAIQALLLGIGFIAVGIPGAGILALLVLLLGIMQIPVLLISIPAIFYVFSQHDSTTGAVIFTVYALVAGSVDNVLKPLLLGRGVAAPMPVILAGALGGIATGGIIGLFLGAVILALSHQLFMAWVHGNDGGENREAPAADLEP